MFGENLTLTGLLDDTVHIGDRFRIGTAILTVTQPRLPCYKLGIKFGREDMLERFLDRGLTGFYFAILEEGEVAAGDPISLLDRDEHEIRVSDITHLYKSDKHDLELLQRVVQVRALPEAWRRRFQQRIVRIASRS